MVDLASLYARRWSIKPGFRSLKGQYFNLENAYLRCHLKLQRLVLFASFAGALCLRVGQGATKYNPPIAPKEVSYGATNLSRHGLNVRRQNTRPATISTNALAQ